MKIFDADKTRMIGLPCGEKNYDNMLRRFHFIPKGAGSYLAGMAVAIPILNVDGRRHTNNFSKNI